WVCVSAHAGHLALHAQKRRGCERAHGRATAREQWRCDDARADRGAWTRRTARFHSARGVEGWIAEDRAAGLVSRHIGSALGDAARWTQARAHRSAGRISGERT